MAITRGNAETTTNPDSVHGFLASVVADYFVEAKQMPRRGLPWITLYDNDRAEHHPAAIEYGIIGIPTMILIDREGKVVSTTARGDELSRLLRQLLIR
jgi:hypothetical protein